MLAAFLLGLAVGFLAAWAAAARARLRQRDAILARFEQMHEFVEGRAAEVEVAAREALRRVAEAERAQVAGNPAGGVRWN